MPEADRTAEFEGWAVVELMGHRRIGGYVREAALAGAPFLRVDMPARDRVAGMTQFYQPSALYCLTPCTEDAARTADLAARPEPITRWELPRALPVPSGATEAREQEKPRPCASCGGVYCDSPNCGGVYCDGQPF